MTIEIIRMDREPRVYRNVPVSSIKITPDMVIITRPYGDIAISMADVVKIDLSA